MILYSFFVVFSTELKKQTKTKHELLQTKACLMMHSDIYIQLVYTNKNVYINETSTFSLQSVDE